VGKTGFVGIVGTGEEVGVEEGEDAVMGGEGTDEDVRVVELAACRGCSSWKLHFDRSESSNLSLGDADIKSKKPG
jgi:hypothetical protein